MLRPKPEGNVASLFEGSPRIKVVRCRTILRPNAKPKCCNDPPETPKNCLGRVQALGDSVIVNPEQHNPEPQPGNGGVGRPDINRISPKRLILSGGEGGTRTPDPVIMSHVL